MNKAYLAIIAALGIPAFRAMGSGNKGRKSSKNKHPSQIFGELYKDRIVYQGKNTPAEYSRQPKYSEEILKNVSSDKILTELKQLFERDRTARNTFESIVSDFYLRPKYWQSLFNSIIRKQSLFIEIPGSSIEIDPNKLNPTVNSQFFTDGSEDLTILSYASKKSKIAINRESDLFEFFEGNDMLELATQFYAEYIYYPSGSTLTRISKGILFWSMVLNSVIVDLASRTTLKSIQQAFGDREKWTKRNEQSVENSVRDFFLSERNGSNILSEVNIDIDIDEKPILVKQKVYLQRSDIKSMTDIKKVSKQITRDALDNWLFGIKVETSSGVITMPVTSIQYVSKVGRSVISGKRMLLTDKNRPAALGQEWVQNFMKGQKFTTMISSFNRREKDLVYSPVSIDFAAPETSITIRRTTKPEAEEWIRRVHNALPKFPVAGLLDIIGAYNFEGKLMGIMVLNTPPHVNSKEDAPGQFHIIDISRIAVANTDAGRGIAVKLAKWAIENKELYNRSAWYGNANVVTYSMLQESGVTYRQSGFVPTRLSKPGKKHEGTGDMISGTWKIRWESNPFPQKESNPIPKVKWWLTKLHTAYVKWTQCYKWNYSRNCWVHIKPDEKTLKTKDIQGLVPNEFGTAHIGFVALKTLIRVCGYSPSEAEREISISFNNEEYTMVRFKNLMVSQGGNFQIAKQPVLDWINSQKRICPHGDNILIAKEKRCD